MSGFAVLAEGFGLAEAPVWDGEGLLFSDVVFGGVRRIGADGRVHDVMSRRRGIGGMALHEDGGILMTGRDILHLRPDGEHRVVADRHPGDSGFNDLGTLADGTVVAGVLRFQPFQGDAPVPGALRFLRAGGASEDLETPDIAWPNGIAAAPDGERFYVADYDAGVVWRDGTERWAESPSGDADGLAVDSEGGVWVALGGGASVGRFAPDGSLAETLDVPGDFVSSVCFGGDGLEDLYVTTLSAVLRTRVGVAGLPVPVARV